jgi:hypothetical protein
MQTIQSLERTGPDGRLTLHQSLGQPNTEFEVVVVAQPKTTGTGASTNKTSADPWQAINAFRQRLVASGRSFSDSADLICEDRNR